MWVLVDSRQDRNESIVDGEPVGATNHSHIRVGLVVIIDPLMDKLRE